MTLKLKTCEFVFDFVAYLGGGISRGELKVLKTTTDAVQQLCYPKEILQMRPFL